MHKWNDNTYSECGWNPFIFSMCKLSFPHSHADQPTNLPTESIRTGKKIDNLKPNVPKPTQTQRFIYVRCANIHLINYMLVKLAALIGSIAFNFDSIWICDAGDADDNDPMWKTLLHTKAHERRGHDLRQYAHPTRVKHCFNRNIGLFHAYNECLIYHFIVLNLYQHD